MSNEQQGLDRWDAFLILFIFVAAVIFSWFVIKKEVQVIGERKEEGIQFAYGEVEGLTTIHGIYWNVHIEGDNYIYTYDTGDFWGDCPIEQGMTIAFTYEWQKNYYEDCDGSDPRMIWSPTILDFEEVK